MRAVIAAIVGESGRQPIDPAEARALSARAKLPRAETPQLQNDGPLALIRIPIRPSEQEPIRSEIGARVVLDGTVDNRWELARHLGVTPSHERDVTSEQVVVAAYERWGENAPSRLIGEFAFVLWDPRQQRLFAARDALGVRELFFIPPSSGRGDMRLASQLQMLHGSFQVSDLDEEYVADFLVNQVHTGSRTIFRQARRLPAGHWLSLREDELEVRKYWEPTEQAPYEFTDEIEAAEHFREVFQEAVDRCLRTGGRTWAELSGGLDSSSIVCMAQKVFRETADRGQGFGTVSLVWDDTPQSDERPWMQSVVEKYGLTNDQIVCDDLFFDGAYEASRYRSDPHFGLFCHPMFWEEGKHLESRGVTTLLSGARAEAVVLSESVPPVHLADHLRTGRIGMFFRELSRWQVSTQKPLVNLAYSFGLRPLLRRDLFLRSDEDRDPIDPWLRQDFVRRYGLRERARRSPTSRSFRSRAQGLQADHLLRSEQMITRGSLEWGCEIRHPFLYRPLVELALRIPWEHKIEPGVAKALLRRALGDLLPQRVRERRGTRGPGPSAYKAYARRWPRIEPVVRSSLLASLGFVDQDEFYRAAEMIRFGASSKFGAFTTCLGLEYWLRTAVGEDEVA